jgi:hypothetical protein
MDPTWSKVPFVSNSMISQALPYQATPGDTFLIKQDVIKSSADSPHHFAVVRCSEDGWVQHGGTQPEGESYAFFVWTV